MILIINEENFLSTGSGQFQLHFKSFENPAIEMIKKKDQVKNHL